MAFPPVSKCLLAISRALRWLSLLAAKDKICSCDHRLPFDRSYSHAGFARKSWPFARLIPYVERPLRVQRFTTTLGTRETVLPYVRVWMPPMMQGDF